MQTAHNKYLREEVQKVGVTRRKGTKGEQEGHQGYASFTSQTGSHSKCGGHPYLMVQGEVAVRVGPDACVW